MTTYDDWKTSTPAGDDTTGRTGEMSEAERVDFEDGMDAGLEGRLPSAVSAAWTAGYSKGVRDRAAYQAACADTATRALGAP